MIYLDDLSVSANDCNEILGQVNVHVSNLLLILSIWIVLLIVR